MKYAVIGLGFIYPRHRQAIEATGGEVLLTCDIDESKSPDFTDWLEMYNSPRFKEIDTVVICTPNYLHGAMAREALRRGKKVICEKPLELDAELLKHKGLLWIMPDQKLCPVLQLRYSPEVKKIKERSFYADHVEVVAKMYRGDSYWDGWKGNDVKSGGILYNLGIHYIDLLVFLLKSPVKILSSEVGSKLAKGSVEFEGGYGSFHIEIVDSPEQQGRSMKIDGKEINLSNKENLSYEDLHIEVYKQFIKGEGVPVGEAIKSLQLVQDLIKASGKTN